MTTENSEDSNPLSSPTLPEHSKYFLRQWTATVPSYPGLKLYRATPSHFDVWTPIMTDPKNNELQDTRDKVWDEAAWREETEGRYNKANTQFGPLEVLVEYQGKAVGYGDVWPDKGKLSIGIMLNEAARGLRIGKTALIVLVQIAFDFGVPVESGTMKANVPMRALMASLGVPEKEKVVTAPGRGVLAEIVYDIQREKWKEVEMKVEFGEEQLSGKGVEGES
jgi:RimJ/RimL family protein N-acetyltransferase